MYYPVVSQCIHTLKLVETWLDKAEQLAAAKEFDVNVLMASRLAPDMKDFVYQIQSACDYVKGAAAWLSGQTPPKHQDAEQTIGEVRERIRKTVAFAESVAEGQYTGASERRVRLSWSGGKTMAAKDYLLQITIPNVYFHLSTAYVILRHNGVDIGKMAFLGPLTWQDT
jgi:hypothetical protein